MDDVTKDRLARLRQAMITMSGYFDQPHDGTIHLDRGETEGELCHEVHVECSCGWRGEQWTGTAEQPAHLCAGPEFAEHVKAATGG